MSRKPKDPIDVFKAEFPAKLDAFMRDKEDEIGEPSGRKVVLHWQYARPILDLRFVSFEDGKHVTLPLRTMPKNLSDTDWLGLREFIYTECKKRDFKRGKIAVSSALIADMKKGIPEVWDRYIRTHWPTFVRRASELLANAKGDPGIEPEDIVMMAVTKVFRQFQGGKREKLDNHHINSIINREMFHAVKDLPEHYMREFERGSLKKVSRKHGVHLEHDDEGVAKLLAHARAHMLPRQLEILDIILALGPEVLPPAQNGELLDLKEDHHDMKSSPASIAEPLPAEAPPAETPPAGTPSTHVKRLGYTPKMREIGAKLKPPVKDATVSAHMTKLKQVILSSGEELGYETTAGAMVRILEKLTHHNQSKAEKSFGML